MTFVLALVAALSLGSIPIILGWRKKVGEAEMARGMGVAVEKKGFDPDKFALQTGTGLKWNQLLFGFLAWVLGGLVAGLFLGIIASILFAIAGGLLYYGSISDRRQEFRLRQSQDILRAMGIMETLLSQGQGWQLALEDAAHSIAPDGRAVLENLVVRLREAGAGNEGPAIRAWTDAWNNPAVNIVAVTLLATVESRTEIVKLIGKLRQTLSDVVAVIGRARAAAKGITWQAQFLALFPPVVLVFMALLTPEAGRIYATQPWYLLPILFGSSISYYLAMRAVRNGLSIETSLGLQAGQQGMIQVDRMGKVLEL